jgi:FtsP/CotA-like multicopper oxidase with cupredoxin domain
MPSSPPTDLPASKSGLLAHHWKSLTPVDFNSTVVANGQFPGPLIVGNKGNQFSINVVNSLTDAAMDLVTSIVCFMAPSVALCIPEYFLALARYVSTWNRAR